MGLSLNQISVFLLIQLSISCAWARVLRLPTPDSQALFFKERLPEITTVFKHESIVLTCKVGGMEPTIHWLKNGARIQQGSGHDYRDDQTQYEDNGSFFGKSFTTSKLYLDCVDDEDEDVYTCVGETPTSRISQDTSLVLERSVDEFLNVAEDAAGDFSSRKCIERDIEARIYQWTSLRIETMGESAQLYCRAEGSPAPQISWLDKNGQEIPMENDKYKILENGDLLIKRLTWSQRGNYECRASNRKGEDSQKIYIYPLKNSRSRNNF
ncbi:zwei Ig domain protein zig-4-like [Saccostrea echinata]|uniref:zwei Ig domain protein zig-4-like n=1 Tax=Saccostrea echinata TaxID=191078 RepID=UPI002A81441C|nr:zwei Ig domain protein zig-4-like [Saccostrea echinata]